MEDIEQKIVPAMAALLESLVGMGLEPPFYFAVIASNGYSLTGHLNWNEQMVLQPTFTAEVQADKRGLQLPINVVITHSTGEAARLLIDTTGSLSPPQLLH